MNRVARIAPSLLNADFGHLADEVCRAEAGGADWLHVDVMDGRFVPNITLGPMVVEAIRRATTLPLDLHLMIEEPFRYVRDFRAAGADWITIHQEADPHAHRTLAAIRETGARAGIALNPGTHLDCASELLPGADLLLVMSVNPGFGGQYFIPTSTQKLARARRMLDKQNPTCELEVDGGVSAANAAALVKAGATVIVSGSFVFRGGLGVVGNLAALREAVRL